MNRLRHHLPKIAAAAGTAIALSACAADVTTPRVQSDVSTTFKHIYTDTQQLTGKPGIAESPTSSCIHNGGPHATGSGGYVCMITYTDSATGKKITDKYGVSVDNTACYVATNGDLAQTPNVTTSKGVQIVDPLYQFDGCLNPYSAG